jgi:hypothetical protein
VCGLGMRSAAFKSSSEWAARMARPDAAEEIVWHVWGDAPEVSQLLGRLAIAHLR